MLQGKLTPACELPFVCFDVTLKVSFPVQEDWGAEQHCRNPKRHKRGVQGPRSPTSGTPAQGRFLPHVSAYFFTNAGFIVAEDKVKQIMQVSRF